MGACLPTGANVSLWRVTLVVPTRFWPVQNVPAHGPMLYEATSPFYHDFRC